MNRAGSGPGILGRLLAGSLTIVTAGVGLAEWLLARTVVQRLLEMTDASPWAWKWWQDTSSLLFALLWLGCVYLVAHFYQKAVGHNQLWHLFAVVSLAQVLLPALVLGLLHLLVALT